MHWLHDLDDVINKLLLHNLINRIIFLQGGRTVNLNKPAFQIAINDDVIPEQLEAVWVLGDRVHA